MKKSSTAIEKAQARLKTMRESGEEVRRLNSIEKANKNPKSLRLAINGKCWDCSCGQKLEITGCTVESCTLFPVRPFQK